MENTPTTPPVEAVACALLGSTFFAAWLALQLWAWRSAPLQGISSPLVASIALGTGLSILLAVVGVVGAARHSEPSKSGDPRGIGSHPSFVTQDALPLSPEGNEAPLPAVLAESGPTERPAAPNSVAPVYSGPKDRSAIALVFDDGPHPEHTEVILDVLADAGARASFAVLGAKVERHPEIVRRTAEAGHQIVSHGFSHARFTSLDAEALREELDTTATALALVGVPPTQWVRPPYGSTSEAINKSIFEDYGARVLLWSIDPRDWEGRPSEETAASVILQAAPGAIVVLHDTKKNTVDATRLILQSLAGRFEFVTVDELMGTPDEVPLKSTNQQTIPISSLQERH